MQKYFALMPLFALLASGCDTPEQFNPLFQPLWQNNTRGLEVILAPVSIQEQGAARATALVILADGKKKEAENACWDAPDTGIATVDREGTVTGIAPGRGRIVASVDGMTATAELEVRRRIDYSRIRISEVFYDAEGSDEGTEFIELYNDGDYPCDIAGMSVTDGSSASRAFVLPGGSVIGAKGCLVIAQSEGGFFSLFGMSPGCGYFTFSLNNSGETVLLSAPDGARVDAVYIKGGTDEFRPDAAWGSAAGPSAPAGSSVSRTGPGDTDTQADWASGPPSPGRL